MNKENTGFLGIACNSSQLNCHKDEIKSSFNDFYNLIIEHAKGLYTPKKLLDDIETKLEKTQILIYSINDLKKFSNKVVNKNFNEAISSNEINDNYKLYIIYFDPITEEHILPFNDNHQIKNKFIVNKDLRAASFFNDNIFIVIINSSVVNRFDKNLIELEIDHELNHLFEKYEQKSYDDISMDENIRNKILKWMNEHNGYSYDVSIKDFSEHMFSDEEFISMISNVCNCLSLLFNEKDEFIIFNKYMNMLTPKFINSDDFINLDEPIKGSILFSYICKMYVPKRWKYLLNKIKTQLNFNGLIGNIKLYLNKVKMLFKNEES